MEGMAEVVGRVGLGLSPVSWLPHTFEDIVRRQEFCELRTFRYGTQSPLVASSADLQYP